jgi:radical SAM protein with 4Fe4S-binding SPASM domain
MTRLVSLQVLPQGRSKDLFPTSGPQVVLLPLTMRCNAKCAMCTIWRQEPTTMTLEFLQHAFDGDVLGGDTEYLGITGGEPTTIKNFSELAAFAIASCPKLREVSFNTNGFLTDRVERGVDSILEAIRGRGIRFNVYVSLDGVGDVHDRVRGCEGAFRRTSKTLERLKERLRDVAGTSLSINSVVCQANASSVEETFRYARQMELPINFSLVMRTDVCIDSASSDVEFEIRPDQVNDLRSQLARLRMLTRVQGAGHVERAYYDHLLRMLDGLPRNLPCPFSEARGCLIDPYGDVYPCGMSREMWMGNLHRSDFRDVWYDRNVWDRVSAILPNKCERCESNCFVHAGEDFRA